jgi:hypothetical protein
MRMLGPGSRRVLASICSSETPFYWAGQHKSLQRSRITIDRVIPVR